MKKMMNENQIIDTLKYISRFVENRHDEGLGDYLHIVIGRTDINVIDETIYLLERKQKEIERLKYDREFLYGVIDELKEDQVLIDDIEDHRIVYIDTPEFEKNYISKDKIRELINKLEKYREKHYYFRKDLSKAQHDKSMKMWGAICYMKELLEE